jgi:hypothetical protein
LDFTDIEAELSKFRASMELKKAEDAEAEAEAEDSDAGGRIAALEENSNQQSRVIVMLRCYRTKSLSSPQILGVLSVKFQHCDLLQREFKHFRKRFVL